MSYIQSKEIYVKELFSILILALLVFAPCIVSAQGEQKSSSDISAEEQSESIYEPGAALLEIFKADSIDKVSELVPVIRTLWKSDLTCYPSEGKNPWDSSFTGMQGMYGHASYPFLVPKRYLDVGIGSPYVALFSFYYEAKQSGRYGFNIEHSRNMCRLVIGNSVVVEDSSIPRALTTIQGVCNLVKGFHRVEFWLVSSLDEGGGNVSDKNPYFRIKVLSPDAFDAVPITRDMLLMKSAKTTNTKNKVK